MTTTYRVFFNHENPIDGQTRGEPLQRALARLRRIFLREIPIYGIAGVIVSINGSVMQEGDLVNRIGAIPILSEVKDQILILRVKGTESSITPVTSDMISYTTQMSHNTYGNPPVLPNMLITYLPPKEELDISIYVRKGTVASTDNPSFSPFSAITFRPTKEGLIEFIMELVHGYTEKDFDNFYQIGMRIFSEGGGVIRGDSSLSRGITNLLDTMIDFESSLSIDIEGLERDLMKSIELK